MNILLTLCIILISVTFHEVAHGYVAYLCGDETAKRAGRLTLNPLRHLDLFGSFLLPLLMYLAEGPILGWAKPVPINSSNLRHPKKDLMLVAIAGPLSNLTLALVATLLRKLLITTGWLNYLLLQLTILNLVLGTFNLIPLPPLDGSRILTGILPDRLAWRIGRLEPYGIAIIFLLSYFGILGWILNLFNPFFQLFL